MEKQEDATSERKTGQRIAENPKRTRQPTADKRKPQREAPAAGQTEKATPRDQSENRPRRERGERRTGGGKASEDRPRPEFKNVFGDAIIEPE